MYSEVYRPDTESGNNKSLAFLTPEIKHALYGICAVLAIINRSSSDYAYFDGIAGALIYIYNCFFTCVGYVFVIELVLVFAEHFSKQEFFQKNDVVKWAIIAAAAGIALYIMPLDFGHMPIRCPVCGKETEEAYIVYEGKRYCLKDGSQLLYEDGVYNFYE